MGSPTTWHQLRRLRAEPPARARSGPRANLFRAALEQSEQLAEAAAVSGYAARPLPLYYMINQAARAIVAAGGADIGNLSGHGLRARNLDGPLTGLVVVEEGGGLVAALASALPSLQGFRPLTGEVALGALWAYLPRCGPWAAQTGIADACALAVDTREDGLDTETLSVRVSGWPWAMAQVGKLTITEIAAKAEALLQARYKVSPGWRVKRTDPAAFFGSVPFISFDGKEGPFAVELVLAERHPRHAGSTLGEISAWEDFGVDCRVGGEQWVLPVLPTGHHVHPLVAWYGAMYALSMLARYSPVTWRAHLDLDKSPYAAALHMTLDIALDHVPLLVVDALDRVDP